MRFLVLFFVTLTWPAQTGALHGTDMDRVSLNQLLQAVGGQLAGGGCAPLDVAGISTDSRTIRSGDVFWALPGARRDGHAFVAEAFQRGAAACVVAADRVQAGLGPQIAVRETLPALQRFAAWYRQQQEALVVGVTGSVGKTTTREMIYAVLSARHPGMRSPGNFNNHLGVPLSLLGVERNHEFAVLEFGASAIGEIRALAGIAAPEVGVVTAIAPAHLEGFGTLATIAAAKGELVEALPACGFAVLNGDDPAVRELARRATCPVVLAGTHERHHLRATHIDAAPGRLRFVVDGMTYEVPATGRQHLFAALAALAVGREIGMSTHEIAAGLRAFHAAEGRCRLLQVGPWTVVDDTYNASPASMRAAVELLAGWPHSTPRLLVVGDMLELGPEAARFHRDLGQLAADSGIEGVLVHGRYADDVVRGALAAGMDAHRLAVCPHFDALLTVLDCWLEPGAVVLVKGSRAMRMERVVGWMEQRAPQILEEHTARPPRRACA